MEREVELQNNVLNNNNNNNSPELLFECISIDWKISLESTTRLFLPPFF